MSNHITATDSEARRIEPKPHERKEPAMNEVRTDKDRENLRGLLRPMDGGKWFSLMAWAMPELLKDSSHLFQLLWDRAEANAAGTKRAPVTELILLMNHFRLRLETFK